jgi:hypothetical protein
MATPPDFSVGQTLTAAQMNAVGLWKITTVTPTAATTISVNNCFTSDFTNYVVLVTPITVASASDVTIRLTTSGTASSSNYYVSNIFVENTSITSTGENNITSWRGISIGLSAVAASLNVLKFDIFGPATTERTRYQMSSSAWTGSQIRYRQGMGFHDQTVSYDGFQLIATSNITATISVYGYRD